MSNDVLDYINNDIPAHSIAWFDSTNSKVDLVFVCYFMQTGTLALYVS